jgi:hypothetical protein
MNIKTKAGLFVIAIIAICLTVFFVLSLLRKNSSYNNSDNNSDNSELNLSSVASGPSTNIVRAERIKSNDQTKYFALFQDGKREETLRKLRNNKDIKILSITSVSVTFLMPSRKEKSISNMFNILTNKPIKNITGSENVKFDINVWNESFKFIPENLRNKRGTMEWHPPFPTVDPIMLANLLYDEKLINKDQLNSVINYIPPKINSSDFITRFRKNSDKIRTLVRANKKYIIKRNLEIRRQRKLPKNSLLQNKIPLKTSYALERQDEIRGIPRTVGDALISAYYYLPEDVYTILINVIDKISDKIEKIVLSLCKTMNGNISCGVVFVESSLPGQPVFTNEERFSLALNLVKGHQWLSEQHPSGNLSWDYDWQVVKIDEKQQAPSTNKLADEYIKNAALGKVNFNGKKYMANLLGAQSYIQDVKKFFNSDHSVLYFITPYQISWGAYCNPVTSTVIFAKGTNDYLGWGLENSWRVLAHESGHLFGAADEYNSSNNRSEFEQSVYAWYIGCDSNFGCNRVPNANFEGCNSHSVQCLMKSNSQAVCYASQGQFGWIDKYIRVEITTSSEWFAGTDNDVVINFGDLSYPLDSPVINDFEIGNTNTFNIWDSSLTKEKLLGEFSIEIKPVKGFEVIDSWKVDRIKFYYKDELVRDISPKVWLDKSNPKYQVKSSKFDQSLTTIKVELTTGNKWWSGSDNDVLFVIPAKGKSFLLDSPSSNDFEKGSVGTYLIKDNSIKKDDLLKFGITIVPMIGNYVDNWLLDKVKIWYNNEYVGSWSPNVWFTKDNKSWYSF